MWVLVFRGPFPTLPSFQSEVSFSIDLLAERLFIVHPWNAGRLADIDNEFFYFCSLRADERSPYGYNPRPARKKPNPLGPEENFSFLSSRDCDPRARPQRAIGKKLRGGASQCTAGTHQENQDLNNHNSVVLFYISIPNIHGSSSLAVHTEQSAERYPRFVTAIRTSGRRVISQSSILTVPHCCRGTSCIAVVEHCTVRPELDMRARSLFSRTPSIRTFRLASEALFLLLFVNHLCHGFCSVLR